MTWFQEKKKNGTGYAMTNLPLGKTKVINNNFIHNRSFPHSGLFG